MTGSGHMACEDAAVRSYARRRPEATVLHRVVREHKATLFAQAEARSASGRGYPRHVREEFDKYERCGILAYGVVRARCQTCGDEQVVAFSCKRKTSAARVPGGEWQK